MNDNIGSNFKVRFLVCVAEVISMNVTLFLLMAFFMTWHEGYLYKLNVGTTFFIANLCLLISIAYVNQDAVFRRISQPEEVISHVSKMQCLFSVLFLVSLVCLDMAIGSRTFIASFLLLNWFFSIHTVLLVRYVLGLLRKSGKNNRKIILVGNSSELIKLSHFLSDEQYGIRVIGAFGSTEAGDNKSAIKRIGNIEDALPFMESHPEITDVYVSLEDLSPEQSIGLYYYCENHLLRFNAIPVYQNYLKKRMKFTTMGETTVLTSRLEPLQYGANAWIKRLFDFVVAFLFLVTLFPIVYLFVFAFIKMQSPGPIFFRQKRNGLNGKEFYCFKFRSMHVNRDSDKVQATKNDPRKFPFGNFMRKTNIDELPQMINVLKGDMSLVGPRPHMLAHTEMYSHIINRYMVRHWVKPGITGWAQVNGFRGETKEVEDMEARVKADIWYIENWSFMLDIRIMIMTVTNMLFRKDKNAY